MVQSGPDPISKKSPPLYVVLAIEKGRRAEMAVSTCMKCSGHSFELALFTALGEG